MLNVVIVNWNAGSQLAEAVTSIAQHHHSLVSSVIIIDNASTDDSMARVEALTDLPFHLQMIRNTENRGFGAACNQGTALANSEYLLFLNPDTRLFEHSLSVPLTFMQRPENTDVGIAGIQLVDEHSQIARSCARFPSALGFVAHALGLDRIFPRIGRRMVEWGHGKTRQVDHVIGAFFLVRRHLFDALNGFDERFFVYLEDLDFSLRARQAGWSSVYVANAQAFHAGGGTSRQVKARRLFYSLRSQLLYVFKHFPVWQAWLLIGMTCGVEPLTRVGFCILQRDWTGVGSTIKGYRMLFGDLRAILKNVYPVKSKRYIWL